MKRRFVILCLLVLALFYAYTAWLALTPQAGEAYSRYYIERTLKTWPWPRQERGSQ